MVLMKAAKWDVQLVAQKAAQYGELLDLTSVVQKADLSVGVLAD